MHVVESGVVDRRESILNGWFDEHFHGNFTIHHSARSDRYRVEIQCKSRRFRIFINYNADHQQLLVTEICVDDENLSLLPVILGQINIVDENSVAEMAKLLDLFCETYPVKARTANIETAPHLAVPVVQLPSPPVPRTLTQKEELEIVALRSTPDEIWRLVGYWEANHIQHRQILNGPIHIHYRLQHENWPCGLRVEFRCVQRVWRIARVMMLSDSNTEMPVPTSFPLPLTVESMVAILNAWKQYQARGIVRRQLGVIGLTTIVGLLNLSGTTPTAVQPVEPSAVPVTTIATLASAQTEPSLCQNAERTVLPSDRKNLSWLVRNLCTNSISCPDAVFTLSTGTKTDINYRGRTTLMPRTGDKLQVAICTTRIELTHTTDIGGILYRIVIPSTP